MDIYEQIRAMTRHTCDQPARRSRPRRERIDDETERTVELDSDLPEPGDSAPRRGALQAVLAELRDRVSTARGLRQQQAEEALWRARACAELLEGEERETEAGRCWVVVTTAPYEWPGRAEGAWGAEAVDWESVCRLARVGLQRPVDPARVVLIDTETTGVAGGAGTFAFLIGIGFLEADHVRVEQYFMRDYQEEPAQLAALRAALAERGMDAVVSYNGRNFDLPLLQSRMIQNRLADPFEHAAHIDLLHVARRLWKARIGDCSLGSVERHVLGLDRGDDVPGFMIPRIYFDFVRGIAPERMPPVLKHNRRDIVSLAGLLAAVSDLDREAVTGRYEARDRFSLGRCYEAGGHAERAMEIYEQLLEEESGGGSEDAMLRLALMHKRMGRYPRAVALWERAIRFAPGFQLVPYVELAKYYEHKAKDFDKARRVVEQALACAELERWIDASPGGADESAECIFAQLERRLERIKRKQARARRRGGRRGV